MKSLWLLLIGALSLVIAVEWFLPVQEPPVPSYANPGAAGDNEVNLLAQADRAADFPAIEQFQSVKDRPLFFEGRRPPAEQGADAPTDLPKTFAGNVRAPRASLIGVVRVGDNTYAMLKGVGKQKGLVRARVGEDVDGWKVESIHDDRVLLKKGGEKHEIQLRSYEPVPLPQSKPAARSGADKAKSRAEARKKALAARRAAKKKE